MALYNLEVIVFCVTKNDIVSVLSLLPLYLEPRGRTLMSVFQFLKRAIFPHAHSFVCCISLFRFASRAFFYLLFKIQIEHHLLFFYNFNFFIVTQLQQCAFSPHPSTTPQLNPPPFPTSILPLDFVHVSFIVVPVIPSPHCPLPTPP